MHQRSRKLLLATLLLGVQFPSSAQRVVHVVVALCDNANQGIVKVPAAIGNGQDAAHNLYWGAGYGVRTFFDRSADWIRQPCAGERAEHILERAVWKHRDSSVYIVADAYDGRFIRQATEDLLLFASGGGAMPIPLKDRTLKAGGAADLVTYVGHDGLMDFNLERTYTAQDRRRREVIILACASRNYFSEPLRKTGASPLLWTTHLMAPEAYTLHAALGQWVLRKPDSAVHEQAAQAYNKYQKCGINGARRLFATGW
ncbi:MAG TPA: hypothetical protein VGE21_14865 [Flavobacteriales bacterium]